MSLIYEEKTELLRRCFFEVQNEVGLGTALFDTNQFAISRGLSYLRALNLKWGIAVDFGKRTAQFTGLHRSTS